MSDLKPLIYRLSNLDAVYTACNHFQYRAMQTNKTEVRALERPSLLVPAETHLVPKHIFFTSIKAFSGNT